jgi:DNA-binding response OmpR family regulator
MNILIAVAQREPCEWAREAGHGVTEAGNAAEARHIARTGAVDALVFDPSLAGEDFAEELRRELPEVVAIAWLPIYSSSRAADLLERGSDDVVHAGMGRRELVARIAAAVRRARRTIGESGVQLGDLHVDAAHGEATWQETQIRLTRRERQVLQVLAEAGGRAVRREEIYRLVWGYAMARGDRTVDVNVRRLRAKLKVVAGDDAAIATQPGIGYRLELAPSNAVTTL